jgi:hypothetical protein
MPDEASEKHAQSTDSSDAPAAPSSADPESAGESPARSDAPPVEGEHATLDEPAAPVKRRKKRKKPATEAPAEPSEPALTADGRERPVFLLAFPKDAELDRLVRAFEAGNYAFVREHAPKLAEQSSSARVREAARELARRIEPDPLVKLLLALSVALFLVIAFWAYKTHAG